MKISVLGRIRQADNGVWQKPDSEYAGMVDLDVSYNPDCLEPVELGRPLFSKYDEWMYREMLVGVQGSDEFSREEIILKIKHAVLRHEKGFERIRREIKAFENFDHADIARRENIPDSVRLFVWQRDQGKCVKCGNAEKLEFDHIIPIIKGGSNTERNIQLLCEQCNRSKGTSI